MVCWEGLKICVEICGCEFCSNVGKIDTFALGKEGFGNPGTIFVAGRHKGTLEDGAMTATLFNEPADTGIAIMFETGELGIACVLRSDFRLGAIFSKELE